ncbi:MAG: TetR/AcrR family transcriptional regulator [Imperialibacter sp.]|uniref:TetR/AcrR family transcriptional regulator n=1 Tax=Imperialibacter sp. TaxID=2038411 RepID=UPI0032EEB988
MESREKNKSYLSIISAARDLLWKFGIKKVTVEEICQEAGVSKMTFYRLFVNKADVAEKVLSGELEAGLSTYKDIMRLDAPYGEKVRQLIKLKHDSTRGIGSEFLKDIYQNGDGNLRRVFEEYSTQSTRLFREDLIEAQKSGWIRADLNIDFLMYVLNDMSNKLVDEHLSGIYPNTQDLIMELTNLIFYGILSDTSK